ncbi:sulfite exporter TauE/SafE family protein [Citricoccus zhacaiensis]|uniref:sulfite exporter TauE/SafE family protein n=1 Tax=Citricoccus zhacaiensis TaxID=489142 RepID=UPI001E5E524F|nr:sulfite exporter TauE/SafE family protein [Citricoccus zhacaiensis]
MAVLIGCMIQRTSGMGVGLVVSPVLVLLIGPVAGILMTNVIAVASSSLMTLAVRADIDWRRYLQIAPVVVIGSVPAALLLSTAGTGLLEVVFGIVLLIAVGGTALLPALPEAPLARAGIATGIAGGFLNTAVGVASPALLVYARVTNWAHRPFAATLQPLFLTMAVVSIATKSVVGLGSATGMPSWPLIIAVVASVPVGVLIGGPVARRVPPTAAKRLAVTIVVLGSCATLIRGISRLLAG